MENISIDIIYNIFNFIPIKDLKFLRNVCKKFNIVCNHKIKIKSKFYLNKLLLSPVIYTNVFKNINSNYNLLDSLTNLYDTKDKCNYECNVLSLRCKLIKLNLHLMEVNLNNMKKTIQNLD